jgi:hypothetical protein
LGRGFIFLPFTGPAKGFMALARHIASEAQRSLYDEAALRDALLELDFQDKEMSEEELARAETELMERLAEACRRRPDA